jgi:ABC-type amino acid transport substrate-binding protein
MKLGTRMWAVALVALAATPLYLSGCARAPDAAVSTAVPGLLDQIQTKGRIDAGYGVYPPYTTEDPNTHKVSGFSVEVIEDIGVQLKVPVVWHRLNWNTMAADLKSGKFDVIADPIFQTVPRAREFVFSEPYAVFADGVALVRIGDKRFSRFEDLNKPNVVIAVGQGWASESVVHNLLPNAQVRLVQTSTDLLQVFNEVIGGRADVAVADEADASRFAKEHVTAVKVLFTNSPAARIPAGFALRPGDLSGAAFLNASLRYLDALGTLRRLSAKYDVGANSVRQ